MTYNEMRDLIAERHSSSIFQLAYGLCVDFTAVIDRHISSIGQSDELIDMLNVSPISADDAADGAYWEIVKACKAAYFSCLSRADIDTIARALGQFGTLRLADDMEYNRLSLVSAWEQVNEQ